MGARSSQESGRAGKTKSNLLFKYQAQQISSPAVLVINLMPFCSIILKYFNIVTPSSTLSLCRLNLLHLSNLYLNSNPMITSIIHTISSASSSSSLYFHTHESIQTREESSSLNP